MREGGRSQLTETRKMPFHFPERLLRHGPAVMKCDLSECGLALPHTDLVIALFSRQPSEVSTGNQFCPGRTSESRLPKASRTLLRIRHPDLLWRCAGNEWKTLRERPMTILFLSLKMNNQSSSSTLRVLPLSARELRAVHSGDGTRSSNSGQTNSFLKSSEACDCQV